MQIRDASCDCNLMTLKGVQVILAGGKWCLIEWNNLVWWRILWDLIQKKNLPFKPIVRVPFDSINQLENHTAFTTMFVDIVDMHCDSFDTHDPFHVCFSHTRSNDNYCTICKRNAASLELTVSHSVFTLVSILPFFIFFILLRCPNNLWACSNGGWGLKIMIMVLLVLTIWFLNYGLNAKDSSLW